MAVGSSNRALELLAEATSVGLVAPAADNANPTAVRALLEQAAKGMPAKAIPHASDESLVALNVSIETARRDYVELAERLKQVKAFELQSLGFADAAQEQLHRLKAVDLFPDEIAPCPLCGADSDASGELSKLRASMSALRDDLNLVESHAPHLRGHAEQLEGRIEAARDRVMALRAQVKAQTQALDDAQADLEVRARASRIAGRISLYLESVQELEPGSALKAEMAVLDTRLAALQSLLDDDALEERIRSALNRVGARMTKYAEELKLEFAGAPYRLDLDALTVVADAPSRPIPMDRMGSAENWLGCHLAAFLALHVHFIENKRPVPGFLAIDQPSQVYFPSAIDYKSLNGSVESLAEADIDVGAVARMFRVLGAVCESLHPQLQIIVTEHANLPFDWFQEMLVEPPWHDGRALIPQDWLS